MEAKTFLIMMFCGLVIGLVYDLYRCFWLKKNSRNWRRHVGDIVFSLFASILTLVLLFYSNWVDLRFYVFLGIGFGVFSYFVMVKGIIRSFRLK